MGVIKMILSLAAVIAVVAAGIGLMLFPLLFDMDLKKRTGKGIVSHVFTAVQFVCLIGVFNPGEPEFYPNLGVFVIVTAVAAFFVRSRAKKRGLDRRTTGLAVAAQVLSPASILFLTLMVSGAVQKLAGRKK